MGQGFTNMTPSYNNQVRHGFDMFQEGHLHLVRRKVRQINFCETKANSLFQMRLDCYFKGLIHSCWKVFRPGAIDPVSPDASSLVILLADYS